MGAEPFASVVETHTAVVFFFGDRAFKIKKPVDLGFVDFSTREARQRACRHEVELNRRLAPDVYLGVADIVDERGAVCDHLVAMRRMPAGRRLSACIRRREHVDDALRRVAHDIARLHESNPLDAQQARVGDVARVRANWNDNFVAMRHFVDRIFPGDNLDRAESLVHAYLDGRAPLFEERIAHGRIRDGHGDLQADDIFLLDDGPRVLDCLEFSDELRWCDALGDVAFLAMDLERLGRPDLGLRFLDWYREFTAETWPDSLLHHYVAYRAQVRAKVEAIRFDQGNDCAVSRANTLFELCLAHLDAARVRLILVGGIPGSGKSVLSEGLARGRQLVVLRTDELREPRDGAATGYGVGRYDAESITANYEHLIQRAATLLGLGQSVLLDASWSSERHRANARAVARATSTDLVELQCEVSPEIAAARVEARRTRGDDPSEASAAITYAMASRFEPWPEAIPIDTARAEQQCVDAALDAIASS